MLVMPDSAKPKGAFFTYDPRVSRSYCIPFYELFDSAAAHANRFDRTCVSWTTYVASAPVAPLAVAEKEVVESTVAPPRKPEPEPVPVEPINEWWDAIKDPWVKLKDAAVSTRRREETPSPAAETVHAREPLVRPLIVEPTRAPAPPAREPRKPHEEPERIVPPVVSAAPRPVRSATSAPHRCATARPHRRLASDTATVRCRFSGGRAASPRSADRCPSAREWSLSCATG